MNTKIKRISTRRGLTRAWLLCSVVLGTAVLAGCNSSGGSADVSSVATSDTACAGQKTWPSSTLSRADGLKVDPKQFISAGQLKTWGQDLDNRGLRATGNPSHEAYIDTLADRLHCAGVEQVRFEDVPMKRWTVDKWSLDIPNGASAGPVKVASYAPYTGNTPAQGVTAPSAYLAPGTDPANADVKGKIVLFDMPQATIPTAGFIQSALGVYDEQEFNERAQEEPDYGRPFFSIGPLVTTLNKLQAAGAAGSVVIIPRSYESARGSYFPYDYKFRDIPSLFVDKNVGAQLKALAESTTQMTLTLTANIESITTRNLVGIIPGQSDQLTVVNSHTDGTNALQDNGSTAIIGIAQYLTRLPQSALPRSIMVLLSCCHFAESIGATAFLEARKDDGSFDRIASAVTIEHLASQDWQPDANGDLEYTGKTEIAGFFTPRNQAIADASYDVLRHADAGPSAVVPPIPTFGNCMPGAGCFLYRGGLPTANYITGPTYLLNYGINAVDRIDYDRMRRLMIAFTQMQLDLSHVSKQDLSNESPSVTATAGTGS